MNQELSAAAFRGPWLQTLTGRKLFLLDPRPEDISLDDIAGHLAKVPRFAGATTHHYSVAQHCVLVAWCIPFGHPARPYALLHDAHEAYMGDRTTPVKAALRYLAGDSDWFSVLAGKLDAAIHARFDLPWPPSPEIAAVVAHADAVMLATEKRDLLAAEMDWNYPLPPAHADHIKPHDDWRQSRDVFMAEAVRLGLLPSGDEA